jgi:hypothetical protein
MISTAGSQGLSFVTEGRRVEWAESFKIFESQLELIKNR